MRIYINKMKLNSGMNMLMHRVRGSSRSVGKYIRGHYLERMLFEIKVYMMKAYRNKGKKENSHKR